ncbi:tumor protein p53-inducible nuclear protein 2 [Genypterus blacodes]|uniref:tumor protein p53-inducible nuclear protein 2 n=1 Tax=Genypterus blacodes TaxID=154954 RepID=UPI003F763DA2
MIGKIFAHLLGNNSDDFESANDALEELMEFEEGEWVIVNVPESRHLSVPEVDPLENLLIEHPSMSVYQMRDGEMEEEEEEEEVGSDEDEDDSPRPVAVKHISWHLAAWGIPLPVQLLAVQRARTLAERKKLSRGATHRQNLARTRFSPAEKRYGHFKQPGQRLYNY